VGWEGLDWIDVAEDRDTGRVSVYAVISSIPSCSLNCGEFLDC